MVRNTKHRLGAAAPGAAGWAVVLSLIPFNPFLMRTLLLSAVFTAMVSLTALGGPPSVVLVQYHYYTHLITVTRGPGKTESIPTSALTEKNYSTNAEQLQVQFAKLYEEGYSLQNSSTIASGQPHETVSYTFVKP